MLIKEFRIPMPMTCNEYRIGQLYSEVQVSKNETGGGEGIEVLKNEPFYNCPLFGNRYSNGQYTYKIYHLQSKVPRLIRLLAPVGSLKIHEEAWNSFPYCRTVITNPSYMKNRFYIVIETMHCDNDFGLKENVHELPPEKLKFREVIHIDIANDPVAPCDYKADSDPSKFRSFKTNRGPLGKYWEKSMHPVMTCYKLVTCEFKWFGLQAKIENFIMKGERRLFTNFNRHVFCWIDHWYGLTMADVRIIEERAKKELEYQIQTGNVRGTRSLSD